MKIKTIISWTILLIIIDQAVKIVIYKFFFETRFDIIPSLFEFRPTFNTKHSYANVLLYNNFNIDMGLWFHIILFLFILIFFFVYYNYLRNNISENKKLLDVAFIFFAATFICALIGNLIWEKGTLDFIYLKPLFVFDLKDLYSNCFLILFLIYSFKNRIQIATIKPRDIILHLKNRFNRHE
jgi:hypothetical protein